jgi:hypothetical protein
MHDNSNLTGDLVSSAVVLGVLTQWLPVVAAILSILWFGVRFYEWYVFRFVQKGSGQKFS